MFSIFDHYVVWTEDSAARMWQINALKVFSFLSICKMVLVFLPTLRFIIYCFQSKVKGSGQFILR